MLSWTGETDGHVPWQQSFELHFALRRLGKRSTMLVYKDEGHALARREHCADLTHKIQEWFGYYLKGESRPKWSEAH